MPFNYSCICVIGATSGVGRALALGLVDTPSRPTVIAVGRREERLKELEQLSGGQIKGHVGDVGSSDKVEGFVKRLLKEYPQVDAVVISAGIQRMQNWFDPENGVDLNELAKEWEQNYTVVQHLSKHFLIHFKSINKGLLVPVTSGLVSVPRGTLANYSASKAALHSLTLCLRFAYRDSPISIREICPPLVESELHDHEGTTEMLSKHWVPLDVFIPHVIKLLVETDTPEITFGQSQRGYERFENGKYEIMVDISKQGLPTLNL